MYKDISKESKIMKEYTELAIKIINWKKNYILNIMLKEALEMQMGREF